MHTVWQTPLLVISLIVGTLLLFAVLRRLLQQRYPQNPQPLVDAVAALLPQTQCAQCNFPGCRPYAEAIVQQQAPLNLCPPGGDKVYHELQTLMGAATTGEPAPKPPQPAIATIDEQHCIGCTLCLPACPVDAIVGAQGLMHTVLSNACTGCELCIPACPVDCISLEMLPVVAPPPPTKTYPAPGYITPGLTTPGFTMRGCINCGRCDDACPLHLPAQDLLHLVQVGQPETAVATGLLRCVECGLCDRACPSDIPLAALFGNHIRLADADLADAQQRQQLQRRYQAHNQREQERSAQAARKRNARLSDPGNRGAEQWR